MTVDLARQVCLGVFSRGPHCAAHTLRGSVQYGKAPLLLPFPGADLSWWPSQTAVVQSTAEGLKSSQPFTGCAMMGTLINPSVPQFPHLCSGYSPHTHTSPHPHPQDRGEVGMNEALRALFHTQRLLGVLSALSDPGAVATCALVTGSHCG